MTVRTCLLISDDPDDHIEFSEALYELSDDIVLLIVSDVQKAVDLLKLRKCLPEYIFINMEIPGIDPDVFFSTLEADPVLEKVKVIGFGESGPFVSSPRFTAFLNSDMNYTELRKALRGIV